MPAFIQFETALPDSEWWRSSRPALSELGQHPIDRGQADIHVVIHQQTIDILRRQVALVGLLECSRIFSPGKVAFRPMLLRLLRI